MNFSILSANEQERVRLVLSKYKSFFCNHDGDLACIDLITRDIPLLDDVSVGSSTTISSPSDYDAAKEHTNQLLEAQIIKESISHFASAIVLARQKNGSLSKYVYCRPLNSKTRKDAFPFPGI